MTDSAARLATDATPAATPARGGQANRTRLRAALSGSSILPSDTSVRYATLVGMVFATTIVIYLRLWLDRLDSDAAYQACAASMSRFGPPLLLPGSSPDTLTPIIAVWLRCGKPYAGTALTWALAGVMTVAGVAAAAYLMMPWWRIRQRRLRPLDRVRSADLHAHLDGLVERMGLGSRPPRFWLAPYASAHGVAFGRQAHCHVQLNAGLVKKWHTDRPVVTAVILHELAHVRNRDIRYTYLAITTWWAFVLAALFPYALTSVLPLVLGGYPGWWPAGIRASSVNGRVVMSVLVLTALAYLMYAAILRAREMHADTTAVSIADIDGNASDAALRRILSTLPPRGQISPRFWFWRNSRWLSHGWAVLRKHPSAERRLAILDDPTPLYSVSIPVMVGAGIAVAVVQSNLLGLAAQTIIALTPAGSNMVPISGISVLFLVAYSVSTMLIAALACVTMWRARLRTYPDSSPRQMTWFAPAAALGAGLLIGEPLSVYLGTQNLWGVFDGIGIGGTGVAVIAGAVVSAGVLMLGIGVLFAWMSECAAVWVPVTRGSLWRTGLIASLVGALAFGPAYASWFSLHDTGFILTVQNTFYGKIEWDPSWQPPGTSVVYAEYLPIFFVCMIPGAAVMLALPCLFLVVGAARRLPPVTPRWLRSAGPATGGTRLPPRPRIPVGAAMLTGLAGALGCLVAALGLALLVRDRTGGAKDGITYLIFAIPQLTVAFSAVSAGVVVARTRQASGTLALLAAFVTSSVVAIATPLVAIVGVCGPVDVLAKAGCRNAIGTMTSVGYGFAMFTGPRAIFAACLVGAAAAVLFRLARRSHFAEEAAWQDPEHPAGGRPSKLRRVVPVVLTAAIIANLAVGGYVSYSQFLSHL